jgi:UDP-4-amino-4,6-dideoxy-L-N-acetyl-beta-L-altrosamine transaminase
MTNLTYSKHSLSEEDIRSVEQSLRGESIVHGPTIKEFEESIAKYCGSKYAVVFSSGTSAKMASFFAANLNSADWVTSSPNIFITTAAAAIQAGSRLRLVDIDRQTGAMDLNRLKEKLKVQTTRGRPFILPFHFAGLPTDVEAIDQMICNPETVVIEDASHAFGSCYSNGNKIGCCAFSQMTIFSFDCTKLITTGEGGAVTTNDESLYQRLQLYRDNGIAKNAAGSPESWHYKCQAITGNFNITSFQAALGLSQMKRIDELISKRQQLMKQYRKNLIDLPHLLLFTDRFDHYAAHQRCVVQIDFPAYQTKREIVMAALKAEGIDAKVHYVPLYHQPILGHCIDWDELFPQNDLYYAQTLTLPLYHDLIEAEVDKICETLKLTLRK